jgi:c(7)-type cytochrome triheme protein
MRNLLLVCALILCVLGVSSAQKPPEKVTFQSKMGAVTFDHAAHLKRANNDCKTCHDKLFPQSEAAINFKAGMHKPAESAKTSCGACHNPGGAAFASASNCKICHVK